MCRRPCLTCLAAPEAAVRAVNPRAGCGAGCGAGRAGGFPLPGPRSPGRPALSPAGPAAPPRPPPPRLATSPPLPSGAAAAPPPLAGPAAPRRAPPSAGGALGAGGGRRGEGAVPTAPPPRAAADSRRREGPAVPPMCRPGRSPVPRDPRHREPGVPPPPSCSRALPAPLSACGSNPSSGIPSLCGWVRDLSKSSAQPNPFLGPKSAIRIQTLCLLPPASIPAGCGQSPSPGVLSADLWSRCRCQSPGHPVPNLGSPLVSPRALDTGSLLAVPSVWLSSSKGKWERGCPVFSPTAEPAPRPPQRRCPHHPPGSPRQAQALSQYPFCTAPPATALKLLPLPTLPRHRYDASPGALQQQLQPQRH